MSSEELQAPLDSESGTILEGFKVSDNVFVARIKTSTLLKVSIDPRRTEDKRQCSTDSRLTDHLELRTEVQRLFEGSKKKNVPGYARYLVGLHNNDPGITPPIIFFVAQELQVYEKGKSAQLLLPYDVDPVAIDGETQLAARFEAMNLDSGTKNDFVDVKVIHGRPVGWAKQCFHDLNMMSVRPNASVGIGMDVRDPINKIARLVEEHVPFFSNRVNKRKRQLTSKDRDVVTAITMRNMCIAFAFGVCSLSKKTLVIPDEEMDAISGSAMMWFGEFSDVFGEAIENRDMMIVGFPSIMVAVGAVGGSICKETDPKKRLDLCKFMVKELQSVNWQKGQHWEGVAGKQTPKQFVVGGPKEVCSSVYKALVDPTDASYSKIRSKRRRIA